MESGKAYNKSISQFAPSADLPSSSLTGQYSLFLSHSAFSSSNALAWGSVRLVAATGESSGSERAEGGVSYAVAIAAWCEMDVDSE
jgi:hypothetical protein